MPRRCSTRHRSRKATEALVQGKETYADQTRQPHMARPQRRLGQACKSRSDTYDLKPPPAKSYFHKSTLNQPSLKTLVRKIPGGRAPGMEPHFPARGKIKTQHEQPDLLPRTRRPLRQTSHNLSRQALRSSPNAAL